MRGMTEALGYTGKHVVVTGCSSGIGNAVAALLRDLGAEVHGLDRRLPGVGVASFTILDLADPASIDRAMGRIGGRVDALFNCAGLAPVRRPLDILKVNFLGTRHLTGRVIERMGEGGAIANVSSNGGLRWREHLHDVLALLDTPNFAAGQAWLELRLDGIANAYGFSKEAITVWTMRESASLIRRNIRMNCTSPGAVRTPMLDEIETVVPGDRIDAVARPIGRRSSALEQAWPLIFLNSPAAAYLNGVDLPVDGGFAARLMLA